MGRTACTEPQCLYKGDLYLLPLLTYYRQDSKFWRQEILHLWYFGIWRRPFQFSDYTPASWLIFCEKRKCRTEQSPQRRHKSVTGYALLLLMLYWDVVSSNLVDKAPPILRKVFGIPLPFRGATTQKWPRPPLFLSFLDHTQLDTLTRYDSFEGMMGSSKRPLPAQHTTNTRDKHPCPQQDSNPQFP